MSSNLSMHNLAARFGDLSLRERLLVAGCGVAVIILLGVFLLIEPMQQESEKRDQALKRNNQRLVQLDQQLDAITRSRPEDPNQALHARLNAVKTQLTQLDTDLTQQTADLVQAEQMAPMLEQLLKQTDRLILLELKSIPPTKMLLTEQTEEPTSQVNLYQHGVQITVQGAYFDLQQYLQQVEAMPWRLYWKNFHYQVTDYPLAQLQLELYTLSTNQAFIGVRTDV